MMVLVGFIYNGVFWLLIRSLKCEAIWHVGSGLQEVEAAMDPYQLLSFEKKKLKKKRQNKIALNIHHYITSPSSYVLVVVSQQAF